LKKLLIQKTWQIVNNFLDYIKNNGSSKHHQNNNLEVVLAFSRFLGKVNSLYSIYSIKTKEEILKFLNTKINSYDEDPDKRWITTWNNYRNRIKLFYI
jgi:integrase/recombinase XerD